MGLFDNRADRLNEMAAEFIEEGNELREEFKSLSAKAEKKSKGLEAKFKVEAEYKSQVLSELGHDITLSLERFQKLDIDKRILENLPSEPTSTGNSKESNFLEKIINNKEGLISDRAFAFHDYTGLNSLNFIMKLINNAEDEEKAYRNHQNAREYMFKMDKAVEQVKNVLVGMDAIEDLIKDEHDTIEKLMGKIRKLKSTLDSANKSVFAQTEAAYLKGIYAIAKKIQESLNRKIIDDKGKISVGYNEYCTDLKNINKGLPSTPELDDGKTEKWLKWIANSVIIN